MPRGSAPIIPRGGSAFRICLRQIHGSRRRARARVRGGFLCKSSDDGALFFAAFGDGAKKIFFAPLPCLGALPLLYPAAPPSVFAFGKYTAPAVALVREVSAMLRAVFVEIRACWASASPSQPQSAALTVPFRGTRPAPSAPAGVSAASTSLRKSR